MDDFDPSYTPNHDDHMLRYAYRNQPTIIWWNLVRFGEALGELMGAGSNVDDPDYIANGVKESEQEEVIGRAEKLIEQSGEEFKVTFLTEYKKLMAARVGIRQYKESDFEELFSEALNTMEALELDFNHFFRRLSGLRIADLSSVEGRRDAAAIFFHKEGPPKAVGEDEAKDRIATWLEKWRQRILEDWTGTENGISEAQEEERIRSMKKTNPNFVPRNWILDEIIRRVEEDDEREVLDRVMHMALHPFEDSWDGAEFGKNPYAGDKEEEQRWVGDVPRLERAMQCSCSS